MLLGPCALKSLNSKEKSQMRIIHAIFDANSSTTIIFCYSLTNANDETETPSTMGYLPLLDTFPNITF